MPSSSFIFTQFQPVRPGVRREFHDARPPGEGLGRFKFFSNLRHEPAGIRVAAVEIQSFAGAEGGVGEIPPEKSGLGLREETFLLPALVGGPGKPETGGGDQHEENGDDKFFHRRK